MNAASVGESSKPMPYDPSSAAPRPVLSAVVGMLQKVSASDHDRAVGRSRASDLLCSCAAALPDKESEHFLRFVGKLSKSRKAGHRLFATEVRAHTDRISGPQSVSNISNVISTHTHTNTDSRCSLSEGYSLRGSCGKLILTRGW